MQVIRQGELAVLTVLALPILSSLHLLLLLQYSLHSLSTAHSLLTAQCSLHPNCIPRAPLAVSLTAHSSTAQEDNEWLNRTVRRGRRTYAAPC